MDDREVKKWHNEKRAENLKKKMNKRGFKVEYAPTAAEAKAMIMAQIPEGCTVILTGSQTLEQIGVKPELRDSGKYDLLDPYEAGIEPAEGLARRKKGMTADVMVSSSNALTDEGFLVNVDGMGNRVASMIFGPGKVVLGISMNKVAADVDEAMSRLVTVASPMNNKRLETKNPCTETGVCQDCSSPGRICNYYSIIKRSFIPERIHIVLIGEDLGY